MPIVFIILVSMIAIIMRLLSRQALRWFSAELTQNVGGESVISSVAQ